MNAKIIKGKSKRLNRWSYFINVLLTAPLLGLSVAVGRMYDGLPHDDQKGVAAIAQVVSAVLAVALVLWTIRRLHDLGRSGWLALFLLPPFTIFLWAYLLIASYDKNENSKWGEHSEQLRIFGIIPSSLWRLFFILVIILFLTYLWVVLYSFVYGG